MHRRAERVRAVAMHDMDTHVRSYAFDISD